MSGIVRLGGGGKRLNLAHIEVADYASLPAASSVRENTLASITSVAVPDDGFIVGMTFPSSPSTGEIVLLSGPDSTQVFEVVSGSKVYAYPVTVYQYQSGIWVCLESYLMQSGAWGLVKIYYYNGGLLAGYTWSGWSSGAASHSDLVTYLDASIGNTDTSGAAGWHMDSLVDLTPYHTITLLYDYAKGSEGTWTANLYVFTSVSTTTNATGPSANASVALPVGTNYQATLDVSALSGNHCIQAFIGKSSYYKTGYLHIKALSIK